MSLAATTANHLWKTSCRRDWRRFQSALPSPGAVQTTRLNALLNRNRDCAYGRAYRFDRIRSREAFQSTVPIVDYGSLHPWIERIAAGERQVLTSEPVQMLETTSGSSEAAKWIPYTASLRGEFQAAIRAWIYDMFRQYPGVLRGPAYWSVSPLVRRDTHTAGGVPIGFDDDAEYLGRGEQWLLQRVLTVPGAVARIEDPATSAYVTLRLLIQAEDLAFISVWNPSYATVLLRYLGEFAEPLLRDLHDGRLRPPTTLAPAVESCLLPRLRRQVVRARQLEQMLAASGRLEPHKLWPRLALISCWTDAAAARMLPSLQAEFPGAPIQGKGLLATEGVVTIPQAGGEGNPVALLAHVYEFEPMGGGRPLFVDELELGADYSVLLTTGGGLWRYRLGDRVRVVGYAGATPRLRFLGRSGSCSDLCGEKLEAGFVAEQLERNCPGAEFALLAPVAAGAPAPPAYALFIEGEDIWERLGAAVDASLGANPHYEYCRRWGQLGAIRVFRIRSGGQATYLRRLNAAGRRLGDIKPAALDPLSDWEHWFEGAWQDDFKNPR